MFLLALMSYATFKGFEQALGTEPEEDLPDNEDEDVEDDEHAKDALWRNKFAMATLTQALCRIQTFVGTLLRARTPEFPSGLAWKIMVELKELYQPDDVTTRVEVFMKLRQLRMTETQNPLVIFQGIDAIKAAHFNHGITPRDEITLFIEKVTAAYKPVIASEMNRLGEALTIQDLRKAVFTFWRATYGLSAAEGNVQPPGANVAHPEVALVGYEERQRGQGHGHNNNRNAHG